VVRGLQEVVGLQLLLLLHLQQQLLVTVVEAAEPQVTITLLQEQVELAALVVLDTLFFTTKNER
jgi:hypothetical protein